MFSVAEGFQPWLLQHWRKKAQLPTWLLATIMPSNSRTLSEGPSSNATPRARAARSQGAQPSIWDGKPVASALAAVLSRPLVAPIIAANGCATAQATANAVSSRSHDSNSLECLGERREGSATDAA